MNPQAKSPQSNENQPNTVLTDTNQLNPEHANNNLLTQNKVNIPKDEVVASNFAPESTLTNKKVRKPHRKIELAIELILVMALIITAYFRFFNHKTNYINTQVNVQSGGLLSTSGWQTFSDPNGVSFKYPAVNDPQHLTGAADQPGDSGSSPDVTPSAEANGNVANTYSITFPNIDNNGIYAWARQLSQPYSNEPDPGPNENIRLNINLETASAIATSTLSPVQGTGNYTYKLIYDNQNENLEQCTSANNCSELIKRTDSTYPYAEIYISAEAGTIDFNSHNFKVMKTVLSTLNLNTSQTNNQSSTSNSNSSSGGNSAPGYTPPNANDCYKLQPNGGLSFTGNVISINNSAKTISIQSNVVKSTTYSYTVPGSAGIYEGANCNPTTFNLIKPGDSVTVYSKGSSSNVINVYDKN